MKSLVLSVVVGAVAWSCVNDVDLYPVTPQGGRAPFGAVLTPEPQGPDAGIDRDALGPGPGDGGAFADAQNDAPSVPLDSFTFPLDAF